jgi:hypothetical protein
MKRLFAVIFFLASVSFLATTTYYKLDSLMTVEKAPKKKKGLEIEGKIYKYQSQFLKLEVEPLLLKDIDSYYKERGMINPFDEVPEAYNYIFFRVRMENLSKESSLEYSPSQTIMNDMLPKDDTTVYQMFYEKANGEEKLDALGKTVFLKPLTLPPKMWIERLIFFEYDELLPTRKMILILSSIAVGREIFEVELPFKAKFVKETKE